MPADHRPSGEQSRILVVGESCCDLAGLDLDVAPAVAIGLERPVIPAGWKATQTRSINEYRDAETVFVGAAEEADSLIKAWAHACDSDGRTLDQGATYHGAHLWQAVEFNLLYGHLATLIDELRIWHRIFEIEDPGEIVLLPGEIGRAPALIAASRGVEVRWLGGAVAPRGSMPVAPWERLPYSLAAGLRRGRNRVRSSRARRFNRSHHGWSRAGHEAAGAARRILVLTVVRRFAEVSIPVIKTLARDDSNDVLVVDRNFSTAIGRLEEESIPFHIFEGYADRTTRQVHRDEQRRFRRTWMRLSGDASFRHLFAWRDVELWPDLEPLLRQYFVALLPELARVIAVTRNLLRAEQPDVVVVTDERPPFQRAFVMACRMEGIPTVGVQDTLFPDLPYGSPIATDWLAVEGEVARENLTKRGTPPEKLVITGQPRFDFVAGRDTESPRDRMVDALGLDPGAKTVLVVSQYAGIYFRAADKRRVFKAIYQELARVPGIQVIVKLHPDEADGSIERELADEAGLTRCSVVEGGDIVDYLLASDLVIVFFSTVGHEAILMGKPLIQIPVGSGEGTIIPFTEEGGALDGSDLSRLGELVRGALADEQVRSELERGREAYIGRHVHAIDGHAADRVAELIVRAIEHGRK